VSRAPNEEDQLIFRTLLRLSFRSSKSCVFFSFGEFTVRGITTNHAKNFGREFLTPFLNASASPKSQPAMRFNA
jgi:hypothetical protein